MAVMERKESNKETINWILRIGSFAMSVAIMVSSWFLNQAWNRIGTIEQKVHELELVGATSSGNRFTSNDWQTNKALLDAERLSMDRRIIRLEESLPSIKDSLLEIRTKLDKQ